MDTNYLFIGVIALLFVCAIYGYSKGFLRMAISLVSLFVVIMVVTFVSPYVSKFLIDNTPVYDNVRQRIEETLEKDSIDEGETAPSQEQTFVDMDLPSLMIDALTQDSTEEMNQTASIIYEEILSRCLAGMVIKAGTFIALVAVLWIGVTVLIFVADFLNKIPVLRTFNKLMGMGSGLVIGVTIVWLGFLVVISFFGKEVSSLMLKDVSDSSFLTYLFNSNPLFEYIK